MAGGNREDQADGLGWREKGEREDKEERRREAMENRERERCKEVRVGVSGGTVKTTHQRRGTDGGSMA